MKTDKIRFENEKTTHEHDGEVCDFENENVVNARCAVTNRQIKRAVLVFNKFYVCEKHAQQL